MGNELSQLKVKRKKKEKEKEKRKKKGEEGGKKQLIQPRRE
jgi:hypothetical protein